jgi:hypothetical protein
MIYCCLSQIYSSNGAYIPEILTPTLHNRSVYKQYQQNISNPNFDCLRAFRLRQSKFNKSCLNAINFSHEVLNGGLNDARLHVCLRSNLADVSKAVDVIDEQLRGQVRGQEVWRDGRASVSSWQKDRYIAVAHRHSRDLGLSSNDLQVDRR